MPENYNCLTCSCANYCRNILQELGVAKFRCPKIPAMEWKAETPKPKPKTIFKFPDDSPKMPGKIVCPICGRQFKNKGIGPHMGLVHHRKYVPGPTGPTLIAKRASPTKRPKVKGIGSSAAPLTIPTKRRKTRVPCPICKKPVKGLKLHIRLAHTKGADVAPLIPTTAPAKIETRTYRRYRDEIKNLPDGDFRGKDLPGGCTGRNYAFLQRAVELGDVERTGKGSTARYHKKRKVQAPRPIFADEMAENGRRMEEMRKAELIR